MVITSNNLFVIVGLLWHVYPAHGDSSLSAFDAVFPAKQIHAVKNVERMRKAVSCTTQVDIDYPGDDLENMFASLKRCSAVCQDDRLCTHFTRKDGRCFLKTSSNFFGSKVLKTGAVSVICIPMTEAQEYSIAALGNGESAGNNNGESSGNKSCHYTCPSPGSFGDPCIPIDYFCDGFADCINGFDESVVMCGTTTSSTVTATSITTSTATVTSITTTSETSTTTTPACHHVDILSRFMPILDTNINHGGIFLDRLNVLDMGDCARSCISRFECSGFQSKWKPNGKRTLKYVCDFFNYQPATLSSPLAHNGHRDDSCASSNSGACDETDLCSSGTDCSDCNNCNEAILVVPKKFASWNIYVKQPCPDATTTETSTTTSATTTTLTATSTTTTTTSRTTTSFTTTSVSWTTTTSLTATTTSQTTTSNTATSTTTTSTTATSTTTTSVTATSTTMTSTTATSTTATSVTATSTTTTSVTATTTTTTTTTSATVTTSTTTHTATTTSATTTSTTLSSTTETYTTLSTTTVSTTTVSTSTQTTTTATATSTTATDTVTSSTITTLTSSTLTSSTQSSTTRTKTTRTKTTRTRTTVTGTTPTTTTITTTTTTTTTTTVRITTPATTPHPFPPLVVNEYAAAGLASSGRENQAQYNTNLLTVVASSAGGLLLLTLAGVVFLRKRQWKATWNAEDISKMYNSDITMYNIGDNPGEPGNFSPITKITSRADFSQDIDIHFGPRDLWDQFPRNSNITSPFQVSKVGSTAAGLVGQPSPKVVRKEVQESIGARAKSAYLEASAKWDAEVTAAVDMMRRTIGGEVGQSTTNPDEELDWDESTFSKRLPRFSPPSRKHFMRPSESNGTERDGEA